MIGYLHGTLSHKQPPQLVLDVNGVGYELEAPMSTFYELPEVGSELRLLTHLAVREDAHTLYGFATEDERRLFRSLLKVSGVGARMALAILSGISVDGFVRCVQAEDSSALQRVPGIGKKTAQRLIVEMRDRIGDTAPTQAGSVTASTVRPGQAVSEAFDALVALGYRGPEASRMLRDIETAGLPAEDIIRLALQSMAVR